MPTGYFGLSCTVSLTLLLRCSGRRVRAPFGIASRRWFANRVVLQNVQPACCEEQVNELDWIESYTSIDKQQPNSHFKTKRLLGIRWLMIIEDGMWTALLHTVGVPLRHGCHVEQLPHDGTFITVGTRPLVESDVCHAERCKHGLVG